MLQTLSKSKGIVVLLALFFTLISFQTASAVWHTYLTEEFGDPIYTWPWNAYGHPWTVLPTG